MQTCLDSSNFCLLIKSQTPRSAHNFNAKRWRRWRTRKPNNNAKKIDKNAKSNFVCRHREGQVVDSIFRLYTCKYMCVDGDIEIEFRNNNAKHKIMVSLIVYKRTICIPSRRSTTLMTFIDIYNTPANHWVSACTISLKYSLILVFDEN